MTSRQRMSDREGGTRSPLPHLKPLLLSLLAVAAMAITLTVVRADHAGGGEQDTGMVSVSTEMVDIARQLLDTVAGGPGGIETAVGYNRQELLHLAVDDAARTNYVYWPYLRQGLPLDFMSAQQRMLTHELLNTALSAKGYLSAIQIMQLEKLLADDEVIGFPRGSENYTLAIFGEPAMDNQWGWRFEGHHLSLNFAVAPGEISVTPSFFGASPAQIRTGVLAGYRSRHDLHDAGLALVNALDPSQRQQAIEDGNPPFDILSGTLNRPRDSWDDWKSQPPTGIALNTLNQEQLALAHGLVDAVVTAYRPEIAGAYLSQIDVPGLRFTWMGGTNDGEAHYWRLDGADFFFEYDLVQGNGNHVHAVWRSKRGDFGADLLLQHRMESH